MSFVPGQTVVDEGGNVVGQVTDVISNASTLQIEWVTVRTGRFGGEHLVPVGFIHVAEDGVLSVPFTRDQVKGTPRVKQHAAPTRPERDALLDHYGLAEPPQR